MKTLSLTIKPPSTDAFDTERLGLPSASAIDRLAHCPGSWRMERNMPQIGRYAALADSGTRIHNWLAGNHGETLNEDEKRSAESCKAGFERLKAEWLERLGNPPAEDKPEERHFLRAGFSPVLSGKWDVLTIAGDHLLIVDYKTGWQDLPRTAHNFQLRAYALLAWAEYPEAESITVAIIRPGDDERETMAQYTYGAADLHAAWFWLEKVLSSVFAEDAALVDGSHCQFCRAQFTCPARIEALTGLKSGTGEIKTWEDLTNERKAFLFHAWKTVEKFGEAIESRLREDLEKGIEIPGVKIGKGRTLKKLSDAQAAYSRAIGAGMTHDQFMAFVEVSFAKLRDGIAKIAGWKTKEAGGKASELFAGLVTETTTKGGLEIA